MTTARRAARRAFRRAALPLLITGVLAGPSAAQSLDPGISLDLAQRRAASITDLAYDLSFRVPADADSAITGRAVISFRYRGDGPVVVDFADPSAAQGVTVNGRAADFRSEHGHLVVPLPRPVPAEGSPGAGAGGAAAAGRTRIAIDFVAGDGPLNRRDDFLYTLFVPARAHEAFPSFDQPDLKARFRLELTVPAGWEAVANGERVSREPRGDVVVHRFAETEPIPTYLFAFAAGRFQVEEAVRDGRRMRLLHRETDEEKVARNLDAIFDLHGVALAWLEEYTGRPYPFGKFDFVAIPSFQYNGMEHPGAILYRASTLFLDESATRNEELGRASVIAHETVHMWFGDLVTMRWFDDVWMKEVFANFMAAKIVNPSFPDIDHELRFLLAHYPAAYSVDRTPGANPIRQPLENLDDAGSLYGAIIYQKAPIVMRQLELLTGEEAFRTALRRYIERYAFGNAGWPELVTLLDEVTPLDVRAWSRVWIEEPGRPVIRVLKPDTGHGLALVQEDPRGRGLLWDQTLTTGFFAPASRTAVVRLKDRRVELVVPYPAGATPTAAVLPNAAGVGYGLFLLDDDSRRWLLENLPRLPTPLTRAAAWLDLREMMLERAVDPRALLALGERVLEGEENELVTQQVLGDVVSIFWRWLEDRDRAERSVALERLLWERMQAVDGASHKAAFFNAWRSIATSPTALDRMRGLWSGTLEIEGLPLSERDRTTLALELAVRGVDGWSGILDRQAARIDNPDRRARFDFIRPAVSADPAVRDSFFDSLARLESRHREEWVTTAVDYLHHPLRASASVGYIRPSLELLREIQDTGDIFFPTRWLSATLGGHTSRAAAQIVRAFIRDHPDYPARLMGKLLQEADPLFRAAR